MITISTTVKFECCGCNRKETVEHKSTVWRKFVSAFGGDLGAYQTTQKPEPFDIENAAPKGWILFDPYTQVTYCPECWESIQTELKEKTA